MIQTADQDYLRRLFVKAPLGCWHRHVHGIEPFQPEGVAPNIHMFPLINASRWMVVCPDCSAGQLASPDFPRFFCVDCLNSHVDGQWIEVRWMTKRQRTAIEKPLLARPNPETRSWMPDETVGVLVAENHMAGLVDTASGVIAGDPGHDWHAVLPGYNPRQLGRG